MESHMARKTPVRGHYRHQNSGMVPFTYVHPHQRTVPGGHSKAKNPGCPLAVLALTVTATLVVVAVRAVTA
jgi:hypothetical protein